VATINIFLKNIFTKEKFKMKRLITLILVTAMLLSSSATCFASAKVNNKETRIVPFESIKEIEGLIDKVNQEKLKRNMSYRNQGDSVFNLFSIQDNANSDLINQKLETKGVKYYSKSEYQKKENVKLRETIEAEMPALENYDVYVVDTMYSPKLNESKDMMAMSSYPAYRMQIVYISTQQDSNYSQYFYASSKDLVASSRKTIEYFDRGIDVVVGLGSAWVWIPKTIFGVSLSSILPDEVINSTGFASHSLEGGGAYTKKYVRFLDTENKYSGSYITGAVANRVNLTTTHTTHYFDNDSGFIKKISKTDYRSTEHSKYATEIYDQAWDNYRYYGAMGYFMMDDLVFKTEDKAKTALNKQQWDTWDSYYDQN